MPSISEKQRRFFGMALAMKRGTTKKSGQAAKAASQMSEKQIADFARKPKAK